MDKISKIKAEIERLDVENARKGIYKEISRDCECGFANALTLLRNFIHSLPEEPVSEDFEEEMNKYLTSNGMFVDEDNGIIKRYNGDSVDNRWDFEDIARHFAKWGKKQAEIEIQAQSIALAHGCPQEPVSDDLEEAINAYIGYAPEIDECSSVFGKRQAFRAGANWQKEQFEKERKSNEDNQDTSN